MFFRELARNVWELEKADDDNPVKLILKQNKNNFGPKHDPLGFAVTFGAGKVSVEACDPTEDPGFEPLLPLPSRIRNLLEDGALWLAHDIAKELDAKLTTVKTTLTRYNGKKWHRVGENRDAKWTVLNRKHRP